MGCELLVVVCSRSSSYFACLLRPFLCIFLWYSLSLLVAVVNDWYMAVRGFDFSLYLAMNHMLVIFIGAYMGKHTNWYTRLYFGTDLGDEDSELQASYRGFVRWRDAVMYVTAMSLLTALSVSLTSVALDYIDLTALEVVSTGSLVVVLVGSLLLKQQQPRVPMIGSVLLIVGGSVWSGYEEMHGQIVGLILAAVATLAGALNVLLMYSMLHHPRSMHTPLDMMIYFSLPVLMMLVTPFCVLELPRVLEATDSYPFFSTLLLVAVEAILYFFMTWSGITLLSMVSAIDFEVLARLRQLLVFLAALLFFRERLTPFNIAGNALALAGVCFYGLSRTPLFRWMRGRCSRKRHRSRVSLTPTPLIHSGPEEEPVIHESWSGV